VADRIRRSIPRRANHLDAAGVCPCGCRERRHQPGEEDIHNLAEHDPRLASTISDLELDVDQ
jgi:hypothetical protein